MSYYTCAAYVDGTYACAMDFRVSRVIKHAQSMLVRPTHAQWVDVGGNYACAMGFEGL